MVKVLNKKVVGVPAGAVYCGRPGPWGNPFAMRNQSQAERDRVCDAFEQWFLAQPAMVARAKQELKGKHLVCWCAPLRCHCETLARVANE